MEQGIKEILEIISGLKEVGVLAKKVLKDGKVGVDDFPVLMVLLQKHQVLIDAVKGSNLVLEEAKNLSAEEAAVIVAAIYSALSEVKNA